MKNFKKVIILSIIIVITLVCIIYNHINEGEEMFEEDVYLETNTHIEETSKIILHITGEVNNPRNYTNRRRRTISRCNRSSRRNNRVCRYK